MKKLTLRRIHAFLLVVSMMICMFGFECHAEAREEEGQMVRAVKLAVPQNVHEEDGFIVWDEVEDAYGYTIQACKGEDTWEYNWYENEIEWSRFIYEHCPMRDFGDYVFKIRAFDETGAATEFSSPVTVLYQATLSMPENVKASDGLPYVGLEWDEVESAVRYDIRIYNNDESHSLFSETFCSSNAWSCSSVWETGKEYEYLATVQAVDKDYHVSGWTEEVLVKVKVVEKTRLATPQNVRLDESGENIIWDEVDGADYYNLYIPHDRIGEWISCERPIMENWKRYISPWDYSDYDDKIPYINVCACSYSNDITDSSLSEALEFEYVPTCDESITVPEIKLEDGRITWDRVENAFRYLCRIKLNGDVFETSFYGTEHTRTFDISRFPEGDYEIELCVIDEEGKYNSKNYPLNLDTYDERVWVPKLYHKFEMVLWDYDRLRHPDTHGFWVRIRRKQDGATIKLVNQWNEFYYGLMDLGNGKYIIDACVYEWRNNGYPNYKIGKWSEPMDIEKHGEGLYEKENEITTEVEAPPEAADIPEEDRITSITINPAFNMKHKDGSDVELDLSKIKIKAKEIYDEEGLKRAETALGETLNGNKHYNLLDLTLLYDGKDFSNGYDGLVKVIIPLPKGHSDKTFSCYRLTETDGKVTKEIIPGEQTEDSYIIYLEHFSEYALVAAGSEEPTTEEPTTEEPITGDDAPKIGETFEDAKSKGQYKITGKSTVTYKKTNAKSGKVTVPATVKYKGKTFRVTVIYKGAFKNKTEITSVTIGENVTAIGGEAFRGCKKLKTVTFGENVKRINLKAFYKCTSLTSIKIPKNVTNIGSQTFYGCERLKNITISTTKLRNTTIGKNAFKGINSRATIKVPKNKKVAYKKLLKSKGAGKNVKYK